MKIFQLSLSTWFILIIACVVGANSSKEIKKSTKTEELSTAPEPPIEASTCPTASKISPCTCSIYSFGLDIICYGAEVSIENAFKELRLVNEIPEDRGVGIYTFRLETTRLTQLDLAPFFGSEMDYLFVRYNYNLTTLMTSGSGTGNPGDSDYGSIHVGYFQLYQSPVTINGFGDSLFYFSSEMTIFNAADLPRTQQNNDSNNTDEGQFDLLPGLSALTNLGNLTLKNCNISRRLDSDTWIPHELRNLKHIELSFNKIEEIGENVFDFDGGVSDDFSVPVRVLDIDLSRNSLNESSFHPQSGIIRNRNRNQTSRRTSLDLGFNQVTTLPSEFFRGYFNMLKVPNVCGKNITELALGECLFLPQIKTKIEESWLI